MIFPDSRSRANVLFVHAMWSLAVLSLLAPRTIYGQAPSKSFHEVSFQSGYLYMTNRDDLASPLRYSGGSFPWILSYDYHGDIHRHSVRLSYRSSQLESAIASNGNHQGEGVGGTIEYAYFHEISIAGKRTIRTSIGGTWETSADVITHRNSSWLTSFGFLGYSSLSVSVLAEYRSSEHGVLNARLSLPLVAFVIRPGWAVTSPVPNESPVDLFPIEEHLVHLILKGGRTASWNSFRAMSFSLGYHFALASSWDFCTRYAFQYKYYSLPVPIRTVLGQLDVGISMKF